MSKVKAVLQLAVMYCHGSGLYATRNTRHLAKGWAILVKKNPLLYKAAMQSLP
jgi:hypothetical protein